ncbi:PREDICTED: uncharacterized protein LOC105965720 [Erythranthe guttata]|uniref:uncharacterized protein LOC105965720 n=1 Tax=Erythranthe guttata TaxID=4155 RepID=UPI00064DF39F|nr:PREDICTED: uncharacterized protein LOC105965720 [Erythranthe guttata]|eukprot:XP_012845746.1 PREDICTED: uncharacterized protein LOC105965720 [Erythranthe guttata]
MKIQGLLQDFDFAQTKSDDEEEETSEDFSESDDYESCDYEIESNSDDDTIEDVCEFGEEDIMKSDDDLDSNKGSDNEKERPNFPVFNPIEIYRPTFELGMIFSTRTELRQAIHSHAIITRRSINITKNDKSRLHAKCVEKGCGWKLHALKVTNECTYQVRTYGPDHSCGMSFHVKNLKSKWLSSKYLDKFKCDPKRNLKGFRIEAMKDVKCHISSYQAYNAKRKAIEMIEGVLDEQYSLLWDFVDEVKRTNPGSTVIVGTDQLAGENRFDRIYVFACFENGDYEWTFISDKQKGLIQAFEVVFHNSDHRFCVRHMHSNFENAGFRGQAFKSILWKAARATTLNEFSRNMEEMNELDENAFQWLNDNPPQNWSRSHFNTYPRCDMLLNNGCESFNSSILEAREKPIVSMLEWIMEYLMTKLQKNRDRAE